MFTVNQKQAVEKQKLTLSWSVLGTKEVELNQTIGTKNAKGQIMVSPTESCTYILEAKNSIGTVSDSVHVDVTRTVLSYVTANFMELANSEDKLASTEILIAIKNADGKILAQEKIGRGVSFDTKVDGQYGPFAIALSGTTYLRDAMSGTIEISINGDQPDTWQTIPVISLYFSDGNEMRLENLPQIKTSTTDSAVVLSY
jgi:hypothetical protein